MGGGGSSPFTMNWNTIMFAPYLQTAHTLMLNRGGIDGMGSSVFNCINAALNQSPYDDFVTVSTNDGFLGYGYSIEQFPSLFDMFGKFMAGLDIEVLWTQLYNETVSGSEVSAAVSSQANMIQDEVDTKIMPKFLAGYRDINAVQSSAYVTGRAIIADSQIKSLSDYSAKLKLHLFDLTHTRWQDHLNWNKAVISTYGDLMKMYYSAKFDDEAREMEFAVKDKLWNISLFDYGRAMVGALNGAAASKMDAQPSQGAKSISMAASGAAAGASIGSMIDKDVGGAWGAGIGGVLGLAASFAG